MKLNNRFIFGILSLLLAAVIAFVALPTIARQTNGKTPLPSTTRWWYETGAGGWGNNEIQNYISAYRGTDTCAVISDGILKIIAKKVGTEVLSVRMNSTDSWTYGYFEARLKMPTGKGTWPAFWMMPKNFTNWPLDGEIDIMEHVNSEDRIHQTIHSDFSNTQGIKNPSPTLTTAFDKNAFNVYGVEWHPDRLDFTLNGKLTFSYPRINTTKTGQWPFDKPFYIILNMAGGGSWTGAITEAALPFEMQVDWVRVYERDPEGSYIVPG